MQFGKWSSSPFQIGTMFLSFVEYAMRLAAMYSLLMMLLLCWLSGRSPAYHPQCTPLS